MADEDGNVENLNTGSGGSDDVSITNGKKSGDPSTSRRSRSLSSGSETDSTTKSRKKRKKHRSVWSLFSIGSYRLK